MKRLIIDLEADNFRDILAALLKTNANFTVENLTSQCSQEPTPRTVDQSKTDEEAKLSDIILGILVDRQVVHMHELEHILQNQGFTKNTIHGVVSKLDAKGLLHTKNLQRKDGDYYVEVKGLK